MRTEERKKKLGEVFTPITLVNEMLDKLPPEVWEDGKTFCDPTCGNGNFLVEVLKRKIALGHKELNKVFGVDIMQDNVDECIQRLNELHPFDWKRNIKCHDSLTFDWDNGFDDIKKGFKFGV